MNYYTRQVEFKKENRERIKFIREDKKTPIKIIPVMMTMKYLKKGYKSYLASIVEKRKEGTKLKELPVVNEFEDVFSKDLSGLPPEREIKFKIELVSGTAPISQVPYRMAPAELKELKVQLQELLDKGFI